MKKLLLPLLALAALALPARAQVTIPTPDANIAEFARGVKFTVAGYNGAPEIQTNFPVLVRLSTSITGFDYNDFYNKSANSTDPDALRLVDIGFVDADGNGLAYEIDTWNTNGESLVWVNLPIMTNHTEFALWYRSSKTGKALNPDNVWTNYAGVWHFREDYGAESASVSVYDSTTNGLTGTTKYTASDSDGGQQPATLAATDCNGKLGRVRRMGNVNHNSNKGKGGIDVLLGETDSAKRNAVDALVPNFSGSFWIYGEVTYRYPYYVSRKSTDGDTGWGIQSRTNAKTTEASIGFWAQSDNNGNDSQKHLDIGNLNIGLRTWTKIDFVYTDEGTGGKGYLYKNGVLLNSGNLVRGPAANTIKQLYIGGGSGSDSRPFLGLMDEVRLCYGVPTAARVKADYDTVNTANFLTAGTVVTNQIIERPVVNFTVSDIGASHIQFGGTLSSLGASEATKCTFYAKVWPTATTEPAIWTAFASNLTVGAFSGLDKGLTPATAYSYALMISNDVEALSYETRDTFTTSGVGVSGTGGDVTRVGDDWIHYFRVGTDDNGDTVNAYTFTPPSYANTVRALVVAGGGPGGYRSGGGGGAGGLIYNAALGVTGGTTYTITVGEGGAASDDIMVFGSQGGSSSISNGVTEVVRATGGGAGGNGYRQNNSGPRKGQDGGSGGGAAANAAGTKFGAGTSGQGNNGGAGSANGDNWFGGGGGGAGGSGDDAVTGGTNVSGAGGGAGLAYDITGADVFYAGGGGGGSDEFSAHAGSPGAGGSGIGGTGSRKVGGTAAAATQGVDGTGSGGGGGCGDEETLYQGGDGGDGIVIIRYASQGDYTAIAEPIISLQSAVCNDSTFSGDVAFRVAWAGYGYDEVAQVKAVWGYAKTALTHTDVIATDAIGLGTGSFPLKADKRTVYLRLLAVNAAGEEAYSSEMLSFYVNENENAVEDDDMPIIENIATEADAAWATISGEVVSAGQASGTPKTCTVRVKYGTAAAALTTVVTKNNVAVGDVTIAVNGLSPNTTYYYAVEIEDDAGTVITEDTASFTTLPQPTFATVATAVDATTLSLSGGLSVAGGGVTTVFVSWGDAAPVVFATYDKDSAAPTFASTNTLSAWAESVAWKVVYSNELTNADGTGNGTVKTQEFSGTIAPVDTAVYTWQAVGGEWSGNWTNAAHWASNKAVCRGYPNGAETAAHFINCTTNDPVVVTIDGKYSVGAFVPNAQNAASDITFRGAGRASSGITATSPVLWNDAKHVCSDTQIKFEDMAVSFANDWQIMRKEDTGGTVAFTNILVRFSNANVAVNNKQLKLCAPYSRLEFTDGTTATANEVTVSGTDSVLLVDDSTVTANTYLRLGVQCSPNDGEHILFRGAEPKLTAKQYFCPYKLVDQPVGVVFEVPVGGYASAPFVFSHDTNTFGQPDGDGSTGKVGKHTFAVSPDSPALHVDAAIENNVLVQTTAGFYTDVLEDSVFTVPERDGTPTGKFKWGDAGEPLADGADLSAARQILLNLQGVSTTVSLTFPAIPEHVSVAVTTNGTAVVEDNGAYTVESGAEVVVAFAADAGYVLTGAPASATLTLTDDTAFPSASIPTAVKTATLTLGALPANVTLVSVTTNGVALVGEGPYTVFSNATVTVEFAPAAGYRLVGPATVSVVMDENKVLSGIPTAALITVTLTIPSPLPANVSLVSVTTNDVAISGAEGVYTVCSNATVVATFAPAAGYRLVGSATLSVVMDGNKTLTGIPTAEPIPVVSLTLPELPANVTVVSVTTNGVAVEPVEGVYSVYDGAEAVVTFGAAEGYVLSGSTTATVTVDGNTVLPAASVPAAVSVASVIKINEVMASNPSVDKGGITNALGIAEMDWVEFYNGSSQDVDITGWYLSDSDKEKSITKATILGSCVIPAGGYKIVWLDKLHVDASEYGPDEAFAVLKLSSSGDYIQLADLSKTVVDKINFKAQKQIKGYSYGPGTVSYGPYAGTVTNVYMKTATPGAPNVAEGWWEFTPTVYFSVPHGYKTEAFDLELVCSNAPTAAIYYTLDGTSPTTGSTLYTGAIHVDKTTVVRAAVPIVGSILQFDTSATYVFLDDVLAQAQSGTAPASAVGFPNDNAVNGQEMLYGMRQEIVTGSDRDRLLRGFTNSIATLSIVVDPANLFNSSTGIYVNPRGEGVEWERQIMLEGFDPTGVGADFAQPAGIRIRGGYSRRTGKPKHSLRFFFRSSYGESSLAQKMFPGEPLSPNGEGKMKEEAGEYDKLDLRTSQNNSWANNDSPANDTFVTEVFSRDSQRDLGQPYTRSRYYNVFINGQYWGLYQTQERGDEHWAESYLGGDSLQYDVIKTASSYSGNNISYSVECNEGTWDAWSNLWHIATQEGFGEGHYDNYNKVLGLDANGDRDPSLPILLNPESLMVYMLVSHYVVDRDGPTSPFSGIDKGHPNNFYAIRNRDDAGAVKGFVFLRHDAEMSMNQGSNTGPSNNPTFWGTEECTEFTGAVKHRTIPYFTPAELHYLLMQNPVYKRQYADLFYRECLREGGALTVENATARYTSRMAEIDDAIVCEAARWGQDKTRSTWLSACSRSVQFITNRVGNMTTQYQKAGWYPTNQPPHVVNEDGDRYFDGNEVPYQHLVCLQNNEAGGTIYYTTNGVDDPMDAGVAYTGGFPIPDEGFTVRARVLKDGAWSALEEVALQADVPNDQRYGIRIAAIQSIVENDPADEFIILTNKLDRAVDLKDLSIWSEKNLPSLAILAKFTETTMIPAHGTIKLTSESWLNEHKLKNDGIYVQLRDCNGKRIQNTFVNAKSWHLTDPGDSKSGACNKTGRWLVALEFLGDAEEDGAPGGEVILESQWMPSPAASGNKLLILVK